MGGRITILDVAAEAGVGKSTAARALRGAAFVHVETRQRVLQAAEKLGYRPDPALRLLLQRRTDSSRKESGISIAFITTSRAKHLDGVRAGFSVGATAKARQLGYRLEMYYAEEYPSVAALERVLWARGVRGLIMDVLYIGEPRIDLNWTRFAAVACGIGETTYPLQTVDMDIPHAIRICIRKILEAGHRRIAVSIFYGGDNEQELLREGALLYMQHHLPRSCRMDIFSARRAQDNPREFSSWIHKLKPDAVLGNHEGFSRYLSDKGIIAPRDLSFVCLNNTAATPELSGTLYDAVAVGKAAAEWVHTQIQSYAHGADCAGSTLSIEPVWNAGRTMTTLKNPS